MASFNRLLIYACAALVGSTLYGCRVNTSQASLEPGFYQITHAAQTDLNGQKVYVVDTGDSIKLVIPQNDQRSLVDRPVYQSWTFRRNDIDVDVFTLPFKIRPAQASLPGQLNSNFNAALYVGHRIDLFNYRWKPVTPTFGVRQLQSRGFGYGLFAGIGSAAVNDFLTRTPIGVEYEGVVVDAGIATIYDARIFNIGLAMGIDHLLDSNRRQWIYQQKPWFGVLFGLNLN
jgi:hypothetical protein